MSKSPLISICIPAYKNVSYLARLLDSIAMQNFTDYEVVVTDDSPDNSVFDFIQAYSKLSDLRYIKNNPALGTPENWNEGIRHAKGTWIKLMHNDDWFASDDALSRFNEAAQRDPDCKFFFSAFQNVEEGSGKRNIVRCTWADRLFLHVSPLHLFKRVYIGNPSCTFIRRDIGILYDRQFKFVVDFEYYIQCIRKLKKWVYIDSVLLNIGFHDEQVTKYTFLNPAVQIPENYVMLQKLGIHILRNLFVYDYYWRMHRNLKIRSVKDVEMYYDKQVNPFLRRMITAQQMIPESILRIGVLSKVFMFCHYCLSWFYKI